MYNSIMLKSCFEKYELSWAMTIKPHAFYELFYSQF